MINDNDINNLIKLGLSGYFIGGQETRLMIDLIYCSFLIVTTSFMAHYYFDNNKWLLSINSIYNDIRNEETDEKLKELAQKLSKFMKRVELFLVFFSFAGIIVIFTLNSSYLFSAPIGYISSIFILVINVCQMFRFILRQWFVCFFISFKYKTLFRDLNRRLSRISVRNIKHFLSVHSLLCESVVKANDYLGTIFMISVLFWSPNCCYVIYVMMFARVNGIVPYWAMLATLSVALVFIYLVFSIAYIDIEAKKGLNFVYGLGLRVKR